MSDKLSDLPTIDEEKVKSTPEEKAIMDKYFESEKKKDDSTDGEKRTWMSSLKLAAYGTVLFFILSLPLTDYFLSKLPYADSGIIRSVVKVFLFFIAFLLVYKFVV